MVAWIFFFLLTKDECLEARCARHTKRKEGFFFVERPRVKVPGCASCVRPLSGCSGLCVPARWLAGSPRSQRASFELGKPDRHRKCKQVSLIVKNRSRQSPHISEHGGREAPDFASRQQQTQPWPTSRPKGSSGSSRKLSKAKRCGDVLGSFLH